MIIDCPLPATLSAVVPVNCPFRLDQIVKMLFFQRTAAAFADLASMKLLATWSPKLATPKTVDSVITSPIFSNLVIPDSAGKFVGGNDNTTFDGIPEYYGDTPVTITGEYKNLAPATKVQLDALSEISYPSAVGKSNLKAMFVNKDGVIFHNNLDGFDIYNFRVGSRSSQGLYTPDLSKFSFDMKSNWDNLLASVVPTDFDALVDLVNAA